MTKHKLSYSQATLELEEILQYLENNSEVNLDIVAEKVKRAGVLLAFCHKQLHEIDAELEKIIDKINV